MTNPATQPQRERLAKAQGDLLRALLADGPVPAGFDPDRLRVEADALRAKRRRVVAMLQPDACAEIGDDYISLFDEYARAHPRAIDVRARDDAKSFVEWLQRHGHLAKPRWWNRRATRKPS